MNSSIELSNNTQTPRPWYISISAFWTETDQSIKNLNSELEKHILGYIPPNQIIIPMAIRHFTVIAILQINNKPSEVTSLREFTKEIFNKVIDKEVVLEITKLFRKGFDLEAYEVRCFDNATAVQFRNNGQLELFRNEARIILSGRVNQTISQYPDNLIITLLDDKNKSMGDHAFGSIARSPCQDDRSIERWRMNLLSPVEFYINQIHILTSDQALSNPRVIYQEDFIIHSNK